LWIDDPIVDCAAMTVRSVSLLERLWLSWVCWFRVLFDARFAARVAELRSGAAAPESAPSSLPVPAVGSVTQPGALEPARASGALQLLTLFQREGRLLDFLEQDIVTFADAEIGAAARLVHEGCRRALHAHARVVSVRSEAEGSALTLEQANADVKLVGNVGGSAPYRGVLRHRGWRVEGLRLPQVVGSVDQRLVAPAELELS
jgi:hypothetical protein